jgi:hypothetical protein
MHPSQLGEIARSHQAELRHAAELARLARRPGAASDKRRRFILRLRKRASLRPAPR